MRSSSSSRRAGRELRLRMSPVAVGLLAVLGLLALPVIPTASLRANNSVLRAHGTTSSPVDQLAADRGATASGTADLEGYSPARPAQLDEPADAIRSPLAETEGGADGITIEHDAPECGPGMSSIRDADWIQALCTHTLPDLPVSASLSSAAPTPLAPKCYGNGVNGPRLKLIYMPGEEGPNNPALISSIRDTWVPRVEGTIRKTSAEQGREIGMRLHMPGCKLSVDVVPLPTDIVASDDLDEVIAGIFDELDGKGYDSFAHKYLIWTEASVKGACGVALHSFLESPLQDNLSPANPRNIGWQAVLPEVAITFKDCWGRGAMGAVTELHELMHLLGASQLSSPNSNGVDRHPLDGNDLLAQRATPDQVIRARCTTTVELLDCGGDDYFNARPPAGSYLSTHWNTANSKFFGDATAEDAIPVELPRP